MEIHELLAVTDHTLLKPDATWVQIRALCDEGVRFSTASVCIPPSFVRQAADYLDGRLPVCTVIGFPNGYATTAAKVFETQDAVANGADEIDMVINIGWLKEQRCGGKILKVIVETCLLTEAEKIRMCEIVSESGADFIKTSTGFSKGGATPEDIRLFAAHVAPHVKIKAAGGISSVADARALVESGADRLGSSRMVALAQK